MKDNTPSCPQRDRIIELFIEEPDKTGKTKLQNHLSNCDLCREEAEAIQSVQDRLSRHQRPAPPNTIREEYEYHLRRVFPVTSVWKRAAGTIRLAAGGWIPTPYRAPAGALAILLIGMVIGRYVRTPDTPDMSTASNYESPVLQTENQFISRFLTQSEIWLLEMVSPPSGALPDPADLRTNREIASTLLPKALLMERKAEALNLEVLISFLNRLEMVLLETSGTGDEELVRAFEEIRRTIHETALIKQIRMIRHAIQPPPGERA